MCNNVEYTKPTKIAKENKLRTFEITMMEFHMCYLQNGGQNKSSFQDGSLITGVYTLNLVAMVGTIVPQCLFEFSRSRNRVISPGFTLNIYRKIGVINGN